MGCGVRSPTYASDAMSDDEVNEMANSDTPPVTQFLDLPCHTQNVERHVEIVSEVSRKAVGVKARDGMIRSTIVSRNKMPSFSSKKDFHI